jgi:hypothetical protein
MNCCSIERGIQVLDRTGVYNSYALFVFDQNICREVYNTNQRLIVSFGITAKVIFHQH